MVAEADRGRRTGIVAVEHDLFRPVVTTILESELGFTQVFTAGSLDEALDRLTKADDVGLALFDLNLAGMVEASNLSILRECFPNIRLVVSGALRRADVLHALHAGVHGYVSSAMGVQELTQALSMVVDGKIFVPPIIADLRTDPLSRVAALARINRRDDLEAAPFRAAATESSLTRRQRDVLRLIVQGQSNKEIARALNLRESTVKVHLAAVFRALGVHNRSGAAGIGMHFIGPPDSAFLGRDRRSMRPESLSQTAD